MITVLVSNYLLIGSKDNFITTAETVLSAAKAFKGCPLESLTVIRVCNAYQLVRPLTKIFPIKIGDSKFRDYIVYMRPRSNDPGSRL